MKKAIVTGAGGFIAHHLVRRLKADGFWVRGVDIKHPEFGASDADEFLILDLRNYENCVSALTISGGFDNCYHLAADMGGMGFIHSEGCAIMRNNGLININMITAAASLGVKRYFFSSSVCVYRNMGLNENELVEDDAYPAMPDNEYGWEKLFAERLALASAKKYGIHVRIARFQNCYGPEGAWTGGREKAPAALCRKVAEAENGGIINVWGNGEAVRSYIYIDDMINAICCLMASDILTPANIGTSEYVNVKRLIDVICQVAKKKVRINYVEGPVGVISRNFSNSLILKTGWRPKFDLLSGIKHTYPWIEGQVKAQNGPS